jgi:hypothetical protein
MSGLVAPLSSKYCYYFYILAILSVVLLALYFVGHVITLIHGKEKFTLKHIIDIIIGSFGLILIYIENRLLYNMCRATI